MAALNGITVLVVDDDETTAELVSSVLQSQGADVSQCSAPTEAFELIKQTKPGLVILDLMMPGADGYEICKQVRETDDLDDTRIVILSAKTYDYDRRQAFDLGADGFISKPIDPSQFGNQIKNILESGMSIKYWGVRGTLPVPGEGSLRYGGNTSCISLRFPRNRNIIFDAGSGIKHLSDDVMKRSGGKYSAKLLITHPHWDHINAFPFFAPFFIPGNEFEVMGAAQGSRSIADLISAQMDDVYFPVMLKDMGSRITFRDLAEETFSIDDDITIKTMLLSHPGNCLGYRVEHEGGVFCYITDNEIYPEGNPFHNPGYEEKLAAFISGADIVAMDTTYFDEDYPSKVNWGHSAVNEVVEMAHRAQINTLHLFHHDPDQTDDDIDRKLMVAKQKLDALGSSTEVLAPAETQVFKV